MLIYYSTMYAFNTSRIAASLSAWIFKLIGLDKSRLKIPIIDFASITYLPDTKSKSLSNLVTSLTNDFTLSIEFKEICTVFSGFYLLNVVIPSDFILKADIVKVKVKRIQKKGPKV